VLMQAMKKNNTAIMQRQKARYQSIMNREKRMKSRSNALVMSQVFNEKGNFN
jgi:hypothetical protein